MASRTVVDSIERVEGPPPDVDRIAARLASLREAYPGAVFDRYLDRFPRVESRVHIAPTAAIVGDVRLEDDVSVWYGCVLRGDVNGIHVGARSNVQDGAVIHLGDNDPTVIEEDVVVGHRAVVHGCRVEAGCLIGIQSTILDGAVVGRGSVIGSCALVTAGTRIPPRSLVLGVPGRVVKTLDENDEIFHRALAGKYVRLAHNHRVG